MEIVELVWWGLLGFVMAFLLASVLTLLQFQWKKHKERKKESATKLPRCSICDAEIEPGYRKCWLCGDGVEEPYSEQICEECYSVCLIRQKLE